MGAILVEANRRIAPATGELMPALAQRFADANRNLAADSLKMVGTRHNSINLALPFITFYSLVLRLDAGIRLRGLAGPKSE